MSSGVQFDEESFKPLKRQIVENETGSSLVRFLIRYRIMKTKAGATAFLITCIVLLFLASAVFIILGEMRIQINAPAFQSNLTQTKP